MVEEMQDPTTEYGGRKRQESTGQDIQPDPPGVISGLSLYQEVNILITYEHVRRSKKLKGKKLAAAVWKGADPPPEKMASKAYRPQLLQPALATMGMWLKCEDRIPPSVIYVQDNTHEGLQ